MAAVAEATEVTASPLAGARYRTTLAKQDRSTISKIAKRRQSARADGGRDYIARRDELIAIAARLFRENGFEGTTLADVAKRARLDRATVYYYVGNKQELFQTSIDGVLAENMATAELLLAESTISAREKLRLLAVHLLSSYDRNYPQMFVYIQEQMHQVGNDPSKWAKDMMKKNRRIDAVVRELVEAGIAAGELRRDLDALVAARGWFGMLNWTHRWYRPGTLSAEKIAEIFDKIFFEGMQLR